MGFGSAGCGVAQHGAGTEGPVRNILDMSEYTSSVFGTVGEVSKGVRRTTVAACCRVLAADPGALLSPGTRCVFRAHQGALLAGAFIGVLSLVVAQGRARCLIKCGSFVRHLVAEVAKRSQGSPSPTPARVARALCLARILQPSCLARVAGCF